MSDDAINTEKKNVLRVYAAFGAALILSLVPTMFAAMFSLFLGTGVLVAAYIIRSKSDHGGLSENHMRFIIRTIWIGSLFALITTAIGSAYLFFNLDNTPLTPCLSGFLANAETITNLNGLKGAFGGCYEPYWVINAHTFIKSGIIVALPILVYFAARYARGLSRAMNGYRVAKPLAWF